MWNQTLQSYYPEVNIKGNYDWNIKTINRVHIAAKAYRYVLMKF